MKDKQELKDEQKFYLKTCKEYEEQRDKQDGQKPRMAQIRQVSTIIQRARGRDKT